MADSPQKELKDKLEKLHREGEERAAQRLAETLGLAYADLGKTPISLEAVRVLSEVEAKQARVAGVELNNKKLALAVIDPQSPETKKAIEDLLKKNYEVKVVVVSVSSMNDAWRFYKFIKLDSGKITGKVVVSQERINDLRARLTSIEAVNKEIGSLDFPRSFLSAQ